MTTHLLSRMSERSIQIGLRMDGSECKYCVTGFGPTITVPRKTPGWTSCPMDLYAFCGLFTQRATMRYVGHRTWHMIALLIMDSVVLKQVPAVEGRTMFKSPPS